VKSAADAVFTIVHVATAVLGFGAVAMTGVQALIARRAPAASSSARYFKPGLNWVALSLLLTPLFGAAIEVMNGYPDVHQLWPWLALAIWIVAGAVGLIVHWPAERSIQRLLPAVAAEVAVPARPTAPPVPSVAPISTFPGGELNALDKACLAAAASSAVMVLAFLGALVVMVVQPH
jgi:hypothetical protein